MERQLKERNLSCALVCGSSAQLAIDEINTYIYTQKSKYMIVDIKSMNLMDACRVSTLCSTNHYIKHPDGQIGWFVSSAEVERICKPLSLGNSRYYIL